MLVYAHDQQCELLSMCLTEISDSAASHGHVNILEWLTGNFKEYSVSLMATMTATKNGHLKVTHTHKHKKYNYL